ncbi:MAG: hypothetical protein WAV90_24745 [Gordonia amarae]
MEPNGGLLRLIRVTMYPTDSFGLVRREAAHLVGICDREIASAIRDDHLLRLYPGVYVRPSDDFAGREGAQRLHRLTAIAIATSTRTGGPILPISHDSAAAMHAVPLLKPSIRQVHVVTGQTSGGGIRRHRHLHAAPIDDDEITTVDGIAVTSPERTAVDVACAGTFAQALTAFDQTIRRGGDAALMAEILTRRRRVGGRRAARALSMADGASESVGESWSRAQMIEAGLPIPRLQHRFVCRSGTYATDFDWDERLVGEFDGKVKYGRLLRIGENATDAVVREKVREDEIRAQGPMVIRWTWPTLESGTLPALLHPWLTKFGLLTPASQFSSR